MPTQRRKKSNLFIENINCSENFATKNKSFCCQQALTILQKTKRLQVENSVSYTIRRQTWRSQSGIAWPHIALSYYTIYVIYDYYIIMIIQFSINEYWV
jgi:hypothetical protein